MTSAHWFHVYLYLKTFCVWPHFWATCNGRIFKIVAQAIAVPKHFAGILMGFVGLGISHSSVRKSATGGCAAGRERRDWQSLLPGLLGPSGPLTIPTGL